MSRSDNQSRNNLILKAVFKQGTIDSECTWLEWLLSRALHVDFVTMKINYRNISLEPLR